MDISGFELSTLNEVIHFRLSFQVLDLQSPGGDAYYCSAERDGLLDIVAVEPLKNEGTLCGHDSWPVLALSIVRR